MAPQKEAPSARPPPPKKKIYKPTDLGCAEGFDAVPVADDVHAGAARDKGGRVGHDGKDLLVCECVCECVCVCVCVFCGIID
jgi:hypothetical protein